MVESINGSKPQFPIKAEIFRNLNHDLSDGLQTKKQKTTVADLMQVHNTSPLGSGMPQNHGSQPSVSFANKYMGHNKPFQSGKLGLNLKSSVSDPSASIDSSRNSQNTHLTPNITL